MKQQRKLKALVEKWQETSEWAKIQRRVTARESGNSSLDNRQVAHILMIAQL